jgi:zinc transporter 1/2/3
MEDYNILKILFIITALLEAFFMGIIPVKCKYFKESPKVLGIANAFSGGVFISICLMHIMPEQTEHFNDLEYDTKLPLPFLFLISGYILILVLDKVLFDTHSVFHNDDDHNHHSFIGEQTVKASMILR